MPAAAARSRIARDAASSHCTPNVIVPRQTWETRRPVRPRKTWRMRSAALELRAPLLREGLHAFLVVLAVEAVGDQLVEQRDVALVGGYPSCSTVFLADLMVSGAFRAIVSAYLRVNVSSSALG